LIFYTVKEFWGQADVSIVTLFCTWIYQRHSS